MTSTTGDRRLVVTGGAHGIGWRTAVHAGRRGYRVLILDRDPVALERAATDWATAAEGAPTPIVVELDITDADAVSAWADAEAADGFDALVNNAGIFRGGPLQDLSVADWRATLDVNLTGAFIVTQAVGRHMLAAGRGAVVGIASVGSLDPSAGGGSYSASKAGIAMLMAQFALEWGPRGVRVNTVSPGLIRAGLAASFYDDEAVAEGRRRLVPLGRLGSAADVAEAVLFLCSDHASYINGHNLVVDGGLTRTAVSNAPRYAD